MMAALAHRGPDGEGVFERGEVSLGHRRLSIVDLSEAGRQPMRTELDDLVLVANGEIYNYPTLRAQFESGGAIFRSGSDSEIILHAYRAHGEGAFAMLNGMFAFALYDGTRQKLYLVRDRLGIKPLYFMHDEAVATLWFASEAKAILAGVGKPSWRVDPAALAEYLRHQNLVTKGSLFEGVSLVPPGSFVCFSQDGLTSAPYWTAPDPDTAPAQSFEASVAAFRQTFGEAVARHLMSDVPVASYLSSGFDSSMVAATAQRQRKEPMAVFTGSFAEGAWYDEAGAAGRIAGHIGAQFHKVNVTAADFERCFDDVIHALDEPRMGIGAFSQFVVAEAAARHVKVILTGHGGDELFAGYPVFKLALLFDARCWRDRLAVLAGVRLSEWPHIAYFLMRLCSGRGESALLPVIFSKRLVESALRPQLAERIAGQPVTGTKSASGRSLYSCITQDYLGLYLPGLLLVEDKISMAHALESRTPFLDNALVALALATPAAAKLHGGALKAIIKQSARGVLPDEVFSLPKRGFPTPLAAWLRGPLRNWLEARLLARESRLRDLFTEEFLQRMVKDYQGSWRRWLRPLDEIQTHRMWMLLSLESWIRQTEARSGVRLKFD